MTGQFGTHTYLDLSRAGGGAFEFEAPAIIPGAGRNSFRFSEVIISRKDFDIS
jgi:hypothetical protein